MDDADDRALALVPDPDAVRTRVRNAVAITPREVLVACAIAAAPLASRGVLSTLPLVQIKIGLAALSVFVLVVAWTTARHRSSSPLTWAAFAYLFSLAISTVSAGVPSTSIQLFLAFVALTSSVLLADSLRRGAAFGIVYWASVIHLVLATIFHETASWVDGRTRLSGFTHPILLGFEAGCVIVVALIIIASRRRAIFAWITLALALTVLYQAFSRQALIASVIGVAILAVVITGRTRGTRQVAVLFATTFSLLLIPSDFWLDSLGETSGSITNATGRTSIWEGALSALPRWMWIGYGYGSGPGSTGPDSYIYSFTSGQPVESATIQVYIMAGILGLATWGLIIIVVLVGAFKARGEPLLATVCLSPMLVVSVIMSNGLSGDSFQWYWLLGIGSLVWATSTKFSPPQIHVGRKVSTDFVDTAR